MSRNSLRFVLVALVFAGAMSVLTVDASNSTGLQANTQDESGVERPKLQIEPANESLTTRNTTTLLVYLGNPPWNTRPKYVVLRIWSPGYDELGLLVNGESPDVSFEQGVGWEFHRDLEPGRHTIYTATLGPNSRPGNYSIFAAGVYVESGELTTETVQANVTVESVRPPPQPPLCKQIVGAVIAAIVGLIEWIVEHPRQAISILLTALGVLIAFSQLLISLYGRDRFLAGVRWPVRWIRDNGDRQPEEQDQETSK